MHHLDAREIVSVVQFVVFLVAAISLFSIWEIGRPNQQGEASRHSSIIFLAVACLVWAGMAVFQYRQSDSQNINLLPSVFRTLLSTINTAFIVGTTIGLEVYEPFVVHLRSLLKARWTSISLYGTIVTIMVTCGIIGFGSSMAAMTLFDVEYAGIPDMIISALVLGLVLVGLFRSFYKRRFLVLAWLSLVVVGLYIMVQFVELPWLTPFFATHPKYDDLRWVANLSFKTTLCLLFVSLIVSWMYDQAKRSQERPFLRIVAPYYDDQKPVFEVQYRYCIEGFQTTALNEKNYLRVLEMALKWSKKQTSDPIKLENLYHKTEGEVQKDLSRIFEKLRIDPLFERRQQGQRALRVARNEIIIDAEVSNWKTWEHADFARSILPPQPESRARRQPQIVAPKQPDSSAAQPDETNLDGTNT